MGNGGRIYRRFGTLSPAFQSSHAQSVDSGTFCFQAHARWMRSAVVSRAEPQSNTENLKIIYHLRTVLYKAQNCKSLLDFRFSSSRFGGRQPTITIHDWVDWTIKLRWLLGSIRRFGSMVIFHSPHNVPFPNISIRSTASLLKSISIESVTSAYPQSG